MATPRNEYQTCFQMALISIGLLLIVILTGARQPCPPQPTAPAVSMHGYVLWSAGPNGIFGDADDVRYVPAGGAR